MSSHFKFIATFFVIVTWVLTALSPIGVMPVYAASFVVNTAADTNDGACDATNCTLREAIVAANTLAGADTITFAGNYTITLASALPDLAGNLTIDGSGRSLTVSGNNAVRVFYIQSGAVVTMSQLSIISGRNNQGGGIYNAGTLAVSHSTFSGNSASNTGGGIYNTFGTVTVSHSTFSSNSASNGGGIANNGGALTVSNSTFSGNSASYGGGIVTGGNAQVSTLTVSHSTFSGNSASYGGGIHNGGNSALHLRNTIIAHSPSGGDCRNDGTIATNANNLIEDNSCSPALSGDPLLGPLGSYGGSTQTFALLPGSPAIDTGDDATCSAAPVNGFDQRGVARPQGSACDIGAFEVKEQSGPNFVVNISDDSDDGSCDVFGLSDCTLREAINAANTLAGADTITFAGDYTITLASTLPNLTGNLTLDGSGRSVTVSGNNTVQVFSIPAGAVVTMSQLSIIDGRQNHGGGIRNGGTLAISHSTFSGNSVILRYTDGGGIYNSGTLTVSHSTFSGNLGGDGGGISNSGTLTVSHSTFSGNSGGGGGGIYNNGTATISNSTFSGNSAAYGGGIANDGTLTVTHSTLSGNSATYDGGGIYNLNTLHQRNSLIANSPSGGDCYSTGTLATNLNNLIRDGSCSPALSGDPLLGLLGSYGGSTQTHALLPGSPAIDAGNSATCLVIDQRDIARPQGAGCDIGAFESQAQPGPTFTVNTNADTNDSSCDILGQGIGNQDCTLREAINAANAISGADTITFAGDYTITLGAQLPVVTTEMTIAGNGAANTVVQASTCNPVVDVCDHNYRVFEISGTGNLTLDSLTAQHGKTSNGGGVYNSGTLAITNSVLSRNSAPSAQGSGVYNNGGAVTITHSAVSENYGFGGKGGGAYNNGGTISISNSTFWGNYVSIVMFSGGDGGAVYNLSGTTNIVNSTFFDNIAVLGKGFYQSGGTISLKNAIVADSFDSAYICDGVITDGGNNLDSGTSCGFGASSMSSTNPMLGTLTGSPAYYPLLAGSPAIDAGDDATCAAAPVNNFDQRGISRPQGAACDIGAFESQGFTLTKVSGDNQTTLIQTDFPNPLVISVTSVAGEPVNGGQVILTAPASSASLMTTPITLTIANGVVSSTVTANDTVGSYSVIASALGAANVAFNLTNALAGTTTSVTSTPNPSIVGQAVTFTATVTSAVDTPTGSVQFYADGAALGSPLALSNGQASLSTSALAVGTHPITATYSGDANHNGGTSNQVDQVVNHAKIYLPLISHNFVNAPDLIVQSLTANANTVQVVIKNQGTAPVIDEFWVDVYINPTSAPTGVNQTWQMLGTQGLVWGVTADALPALTPGGVLTLTVNDAHFFVDLSAVAWPLSAGTALYAQVDTANAATTYGAVLETHEVRGEPYNNIFGPVSSGTLALTITPQHAQPSRVTLPQRTH